MEFSELKIILRRLYNDYVKFHIKTIIFCLFLSVLVAGSTSATAWLLDPAVKKIFVELNQLKIQKKNTMKKFMLSNFTNLKKTQK